MAAKNSYNNIQFSESWDNNTDTLLTPGLLVLLEECVGVIS